MSNKSKLYFVSATIYLFSAYSVSLFFNDETLVFLADEDGLFESLTAIYFLIASIFFFILFWKDKLGNDFLIFITKRNIFYILLSLLCFFAFAEEISWGQRILNLKTPEMIRDINMQGELNIHNLNIFHGKNTEGIKKEGWAKWITIGHLFKVFWFSYFVIVPILSSYSITILAWLRKINLPLIPVSLGILFLANYIISRIVVVLNSDKLLQSIVEIKESNFAFLFLVVSLYLFGKMKNKEPINNSV